MNIELVNKTIKNKNNNYKKVIEIKKFFNFFF